MPFPDPSTLLESHINILDVPMQMNDAGATTVRAYLKALLSALWAEEEGFSAKRPFGNSGWQHEVYSSLEAAEILANTPANHKLADELVQRAIEKL